MADGSRGLRAMRPAGPVPASRRRRSAARGTGRGLAASAFSSSLKRCPARARLCTCRANSRLAGGGLCCARSAERAGGGARLSPAICHSSAPSRPGPAPAARSRQLGADKLTVGPAALHGRPRPGRAGRANPSGGSAGAAAAAAALPSISCHGARVEFVALTSRADGRARRPGTICSPARTAAGAQINCFRCLCCSWRPAAALKLDFKFQPT